VLRADHDAEGAHARDAQGPRTPAAGRVVKDGGAVAPGQGDCQDRGFPGPQAPFEHGHRHPRDRDPRAAWLLLDLDQRVASFRRTDYDIVQAQGEIISAGLPQRLADRLAVGA